MENGAYIWSVETLRQLELKNNMATDQTTYYLYGAAVQGIQSFIFQTNKLKEIVGASELVEELCTAVFEDLLFKNDIHAHYEKIISAAGNIKYIFEKKADLEKIVKVFPKTVAEKAPGITVSQAVVEYNETNFKGCIDELEKKLRIQRNKQPLNPIPQLMSIERSRRTGLPAEEIRGDEFWDDASMRKDIAGNCLIKLCQKSFYGENTKDKVDRDKIARDVEKLTDKNDWIAIVHADGNSLGQVVKAIGSDKEKFKKFSEKLDEATKNAANLAYHDTIREDDNNYPLRPVVLGGDDMTVIIRGSLAVDYTTAFLKHFEEQTKNLLGECEENLLDGVFADGTHHLTACAGIAFVKSSYPFYYGYDLAEELCKAAKKDARKQGGEGNSIPSCIMFHKVDDTFVESLEDMTKRQLIPQKGLSLAAGSYYLNPNDTRIGIEEIIENADRLESDEGSALKSGLRRWMSVLYEDKKKADQAMHRLESITKEEVSDVLYFAQKPIDKSFEKDGKTINVTAYPVFDLLALHTVKYQNTKGEN